MDAEREGRFEGGADPGGPGNLPGDSPGGGPGASPGDTLGAERSPGTRAQGHAALVAVQICFGLFPVFGKLAMNPEQGFNALGVASWRIACGALILGLLAARRFGKACIPPRRELGILFACALLGIVLNQGLFLAGLDRSTATNAGLLICMVPVFTFVIAACAGQEAFHWARALGVLVALVGIAPLFLSRGTSLLGEHGVGNGLMLLNTLSYSAYLVVSKRLTARFPALLVITWVYVFSLPFLPLFLWRARLLPAAPDSLAVWASLAYVLVFATVLGYLLNVYALARVRASTTAVYVYMQPVITGVAGAWLLGEQLQEGMLRAALLLFVGIGLVIRRPPRVPVSVRPAVSE